MKQVWMTRDGYSVCDGCASRHPSLMVGGEQIDFESGTIVCNECDVFMPAVGVVYRPSRVEQVMSERGLIQERDTRPTLSERIDFLQAERKVK